MRKSQLSLGLIVGLLLGLSYEVPVMAEIGPSEQESSFGDETLLFGDIPSVFSASKYEQKITEAPARISVVTADEIQRYGHRNLLDILNTLPGFQLTYDRYYNYVGVRGINVLGDYNSRILLLVDGHRINENIYDGVVLSDGMVLDIDLIDRVEVVRGPASSVYGSSAFFGVINVISKRGRDLQGTEISVAAGNQSTYKGRISYGQKYDNGIELLMSASGYNTDGDDHLYYAEFDDPSTNNGFAENVDDANNKNMFTKASYGDYTLSILYEEYDKTIPTGSYETIFNDSRTHSIEGRAYLDLAFQHLLENGIDMTARLFYDDYFYDGDWAYEYAVPPDPSDEVIFKDEAKGDWWGAEVQMSQLLFEKHYLTFGLEYRDSLNEEQFQYDVYDTYLDTSTDSNSLAVYVQDEFRIKDDLILNIGLRHDSFSDNVSSTNPRLAIIWAPYEVTSIKLLYGSAFRKPNAYELYYSDIGSSEPSHKPPITELESEAIETYEVILEQNLNENLNLVASIYQNFIEDMIVITEDPNDNLQFFENKDEAESFGGELELQGKWENNWEGSISYSNQKSEDGSGVELVNSPRDMVKIGLIAPLKGNDFSAGIEVQYEGGRKTLADDETGSRTITNLTLFSKQWIEGIKMSASVYNLFDKMYSHPVSSEHEQDHIEQNGRIIRVKIDYTF